MASQFERVTRRWEKFTQILEKVAKKVGKPKNDKISASNLDLKVQPIYIKPLLKHKNTYNKIYLETAYLGENV